MKWIYGSMQMFCVNVNMQIYTVNIGHTAFMIWFQTESKSKQWFTFGLTYKPKNIGEGFR